MTAKARKLAPDELEKLRQTARTADASLKKGVGRMKATKQASIKREGVAAMDFADIATGRRLPAVHPGEVLTAEFIEPKSITRYRVAKAMGVPQRRVDELCSGQRGVTADTALRLERVFGVEAQVWLNLQARYDLETAERDLKEKIGREAKPLEEVM